MKLFYNIKQALTLSGANEKKGRNIEDNDLGVIYKAALIEKEGKILKIGEEKQIREFISKHGLKLDNYHDCEGMIALPSFVDCHTHPVFECNRFWEFEKRIRGSSYLEISKSGGGIVSAVSGTRAASKELLKKKTWHYVKQMQACGTGVIEAKSGYGLNTESEIKMLEVLKELKEESGIPLVSTFLGAHAFPPEYKNNGDQYVDLIIKEMLPLVKAKRLADFCDVFCDEGFFSIMQTEKIAQAALDQGFKLTLHVDELKDTDSSALAVNLGAKSAAHLLKINTKNIRRLAESETVAVFLPGTPFYLGKHEFAPARELIEAGAKIAIATDFNPGSNMCHNMPLTIIMACSFLKMSMAEAISGATVGAAQALCLENELGSLTEGKFCNLSLFDASCFQEIFCHYGENHCKETFLKGILTSQNG